TMRLSSPIFTTRKRPSTIWPSVASNTLPLLSDNAATTRLSGSTTRPMNFNVIGGGGGGPGGTVGTTGPVTAGGGGAGARGGAGRGGGAGGVPNRNGFRVVAGGSPADASLSSCTGCGSALESADGC